MKRVILLFGQSLHPTVTASSMNYVVKNRLDAAKLSHLIMGEGKSIVSFYCGFGLIQYVSKDDCNTICFD